MSGSINKAILIGNLGGDPEQRAMQDGRPVVNFNVATSETWKDKATQEKRERTQWHRVVIFSERLCKVAIDYLKKGSKVYIEGQIQTRKWKDKDGIERYSTEIVLQGFSANLTLLGGRQGQAYPEDYNREPAQGDTAAQPAPDQLDDEVPF